MNLDRNIRFTVTDLKWKRIFLEFTIDTQYKGDVEFAFVRTDRHLEKGKEHGFEVEELVSIDYDSCDNGKYYFSVNMAAADGRKFLDNGQWQIGILFEDKIAIANITNRLAYKLDDLSRIFKYGGGKYAYNLSFSLKNFDDENLELWLDNYFMITNKSWKRRRYIKEALTFKGKFKRFYMYLTIWLIRAFYHTVATLTPKNGTRVLFMTETKDYLWGNLKYIDDRIKERGLDKQFKLSYSCRRAVGSHMSISSWIKTVYQIAKQDFIFIDDYAPVLGFFKLSNKTKLVQVWHAGEGFKSVGYSRFGKEGSPFPSESCHKAYDYVLTGSQNLVKVYEEVFGIEKEAFLPVGMARLDDFLDEKKIETFKEKFYADYPTLKNKKIILFAPTFRGTGQDTAYYDYDKIDLKKIYEFCGDEYIFLIKMHPFVTEAIKIPVEYQDKIMDFVKYPNINDLYYITDVLITDYSSNYYEYALLKKPVLFYTYDREFYELTRGVHRDVKGHAPGKVCDTFEELMDALKNKDYEIEKLNAFVEENFSDYDGHGADRAIDQILLRKEDVDE